MIRYYNSGREVPAEELWTTRFLKSRGITASFRHPIHITSVFGRTSRCRTDRRGLNVFYTGENIHTDRLSGYERHLGNFDLVLGFDYCDESNYLRFPYWILHKFDPASDRQAVIKRVKEIGGRTAAERRRFCCLVSRHDNNGCRSSIADIVNRFGKIDYGGRFRNNTDELVKVFGNDKISFMRQYKFNICPENSNSEGYVTEKLFDAFEAGCIPVYWGSNNNPEPGLINRDAVLFYDDMLENELCRLTDEKVYADFVSRPVFKENAADIIWRYFEELEIAIKERMK